MISERYKEMLNRKSVIRLFSAAAAERGREIGYENVFDFSIGNPSVPAPQKFTDTMISMLQTENPMALHGYSPTLGIQTVRQAIADNLNERFGMNYKAEHIFMTSGAAGALAHAARSVTAPGDEIITFAPYFPEYNPCAAGAGTTLRVVPADTDSFQINFEAFEEALSPKTSAVLVCNPNNPSGIVYSAETIEKLAQILKAKSAEYGHDIFIISDEPYREILFAGVEYPYLPKYYDCCISCYSFSKSLSIPGERIGYVAVSPSCPESKTIVNMCGQISRETGHNCPPSIIQQAVSRCLNVTADLSVYETNMNLIYDMLMNLGFSCVKPGGTFYIFPKALEDDAFAFCQKALKYDIALVPGDSFGCPGYFRLAYCIDTEKVLRSFKAFETFVRTEYR